jgi:protein-S-isoprenylcysteine O-methyltransferase Ste14
MNAPKQNRLNGFFSSRALRTRLKPGVNEKFSAKQVRPLAESGSSRRLDATPCARIESHWQRRIKRGNLRRLENSPTKNLLPRLIGWTLFQQAALVILLFVPGTWHYWQGWTFFGVNLMLAMVFCTYFYKHDRELLARRMLRKEKVTAQKLILFLMKIVSVAFYVLCGLDHRLGWSRTYVIPVPCWLTVLALLGYAGCYLLFIPVFNANRFAASVIQTEAGQTVADRGPYRWVRHPMYAVSLAIWFWLPLALGSFMALPVAALMVPIIILRLLNEEKVLQRDLPGYSEYCRRTPCRLIPFI